MSTLYLTCGLCGRKQADGILSRNAWGHLEGAGGAPPLRACPTCKVSNDDWESQLTAGTNGAGQNAGQNVYGIAR
jgi:hypothetical protein